LKSSFSSRELFAGKRVLVVEDEFLLAEETRKKLTKLGAVVIGPTPHVDHALTLIDDQQIDAAILDIFLSDTGVSRG
jgi:DNA-binding response OmpR family regulator